MESNNENVTTFTDSIVFDVIKDIANRAEVGLKKYNTTMDREDLISSDWVQHAYEEALDMAIYLKRLKKDMLLLEEELRAHKTEKAFDKIASGYNLTNPPKKSGYTLTKTDGTGVVYTTLSKPNEIYTDEEPSVRKKYNWHR